MSIPIVSAKLVMKGPMTLAGSMPINTQITHPNDDTMDESDPNATNDV